MQVSRSYDDRTARISLQISINVKKQENQNHDHDVNSTPQPSPDPQNVSQSNQRLSTVFPAPPAFPPSVKRCLEMRPNTRNRKMTWRHEKHCKNMIINNFLALIFYYFLKPYRIMHLFQAGSQALGTCRFAAFLSGVSQTPDLSSAVFVGLGNGGWSRALRVARRQDPLLG